MLEKGKVKEEAGRYSKLSTGGLLHHLAVLVGQNHLANFEKGRIWEELRRPGNEGRRASGAEAKVERALGGVLKDDERYTVRFAVAALVEPDPASAMVDMHGYVKRIKIGKHRLQLLHVGQVGLEKISQASKELIIVNLVVKNCLENLFHLRLGRLRVIGRAAVNGKPFEIYNRVPDGIERGMGGQNAVDELHRGDGGNPSRGHDSRVKNKGRLVLAEGGENRV